MQIFYERDTAGGGAMPHSTPAMKLTAVIVPDTLYGGESGYVSHCPELGVTSQGEPIEEARAMLQEAVELFLEVAEPEELDRRLKENAGLVSTLHIVAPTRARVAA